MERGLRPRPLESKSPPYGAAWIRREGTQPHVLVNSARMRRRNPRSLLVRNDVPTESNLRRNAIMAEMVAPAGGGERKLYARKSSGLIRTIRVFGALEFGHT